MIVLTSVFGFKGKIGTSRRWDGAKWVDSHTEFYRVSLQQLWIIPPQEPQEIVMFYVDLNLVKHA